MDGSLTDLMSELEAKKAYLDTLLVKNQQKTDKLANLNQCIEQTKSLLAQKACALASKERAVRDGNVVNNRMLADIRTRTDQLQRLSEAEQNLEDFVASSCNDQFNAMEEHSGLMETIACVLTNDGADGDQGADNRDMEAKIASLRESAFGDNASLMTGDLETKIANELKELKKVEDRKNLVIQELASLEATAVTTSSESAVCSNVSGGQCDSGTDSGIADESGFQDETTDQTFDA